ncbi:extracellular dioxygenase [Fusarium sp. NRRL 25303]|nr:extracellular dioxygenase [Fusarium sp. NRRL 25303]
MVSWKLLISSLVLQAAMANSHAVPGGKHRTRSLSHCDEVLKQRGVAQQMASRRAEKIKTERKKRNMDEKAPLLNARSFYSSLATNHNVTYAGYNLNTPEQVLFANYSDACVLGQETTYGPYYVTGELIRSDIVDGEAGVPLHMEVQFIDYKTCEPVTGIYVDTWHCNSTGIYSGVVDEVVSKASDLDTTFFRGIQTTDDLGVVSFDTKFPGHYPLRATHVHILVHQNATLLPNNTLQLNSGNISHVGQIFFDQDLINLVDTVEPYSSNTNKMVQNADDGVMYVEADGMDPVARYTFVGDTVSEGLVAWAVFGIDTDANYNDVVQAASYYGEDGGEANAEYNLTKLGALEEVPSSFSGPTTFTTTVGV